MPNWCYSSLRMEIDNSDVKLLDVVIENGGICNSVKPMPIELRKEQLIGHVVSEDQYKKEQEESKLYLESLKEGEEPDVFRLSRNMTQAMVDERIRKYGHPHSNGWANHNWGTKWGDCDFNYSIDESTDNDSVLVYMQWESAWGPIDLDIVQKFVKSFYLDGKVLYWWEEEQGFGEEHVYLNSKKGWVITGEWDSPEWSDEDYESEKGHTFRYLEVPLQKGLNEHYPVGYYLEGCVHEPYDKDRDGKLTKVY